MGNRAVIHVDAKDGTVHIGSAAVRGGMPLELARDSLEGLLRNERDVGNGYLWLSVSNVAFGGRPGGLSLCFHQGKLEMVTLGVSLPDDELLEGWPTEESSMRQVMFLRKELERQLLVTFQQGVARFSWGSAWSRFDPKGFMATAGVAYGP